MVLDGAVDVSATVVVEVLALVPPMLLLAIRACAIRATSSLASDEAGLELLDGPGDPERDGRFVDATTTVVAHVHGAVYDHVNADCQPVIFSVVTY